MRIFICIVVLALMLLMPSILSAQAPDTLWTRTYNSSHDEVPYSVREVNKEYIIAGHRTLDYSNVNIYLLGISEDGDSLWSKEYDYGHSEHVTGMEKIMDGNFIISGYRFIYAESAQEITLLKISSTGDTLWFRYYDILWSRGDAVCETFDGSFVSVGQSINSLLIIKTDRYGELLWSRTYFSAPGARAFSVCETSDHNYAITGHISMGSYVNILMLKVNQYGDSLWSRSFGTSYSDEGTQIKETSNGNLIIIGRSYYNSPGWFNAYVARTDYMGNMIWQNSFGGVDWDGGHSIHELPDGNFIIGAYSMSFQNLGGYYLIAVDQYGDSLWTNVSGDSHYKWAASSIITTAGDYLTVGNKYESDANLYDIYVIKYGGLITSVNDNDNLLPSSTTLHSNYPNPFIANTTISYSVPTAQNISLKIYDLLGREIETLIDGFIEAGDYSIVYGADDLSSGIYFYRLEIDNHSESKVMTLLK